jgi:hypothetical protein
VVGFELFNEPPVGEPDVDTFSALAAAHVRAGAPDKLVMFEPSAVRNLFDFVPKATAPFPEAAAVYAPHIYTFVFYPDQTQLEQLQPGDLEASVQAARAEAAAWRTPLVFGEYGIGPNQANADLWMGVQAELHDAYLASDAFWLWKEQSQGAWGVYDHALGPNNEDVWTERPQVIAWISRVHASRIAGTVVANQYTHTTGALHLEVTGAGKPHAIYIPEHAATSFAITCNAKPVAAPRDAATGEVSFACDGVIDVTP